MKGLSIVEAYSLEEKRKKYTGKIRVKIPLEPEQKKSRSIDSFFGHGR